MLEHRDRASPSVIVAGHVGEAGPGRQRVNFPRSPGASPPVPRTVCHLLVVVVTLDENGWRASTLFPTEQGATARGVRRAAMSGITECLTNKCHRLP